jgi:hypothetical protein
MLLLVGVMACRGDSPRTGISQPALGKTPPERREPPAERRDPGGARQGDPPGAGGEGGGTRLCLKYGARYLDGEGLGDIAASGAKVSVKHGAEQVWAGHLGEDGCSPVLNVESGQAYAVELVTDLELKGNHVQLGIQQGGRGQGPSTTSVDLGSTPFNPGQARTITVPDGPSSRILAALTLGFEREAGGVTGKTVQVWRKTDPAAAPCPSTSCNNGGSLFYLGRDGAQGDRGDQTTGLNTMLHELGHKMMFLRTGLEPDQVPRDKNAPGYGRCPGGEDEEGHRRDSVEWNSLALIEGFAHFYASVVLNQGPNAECRSFSHYAVDWNHDGTKDGKPYRCDAAPVPGLKLADRDYLGTECGPSPRPGTANEYDYQRFFWYLYHDDKVPLDTIMDVIAGANKPTPWNKTWIQGSPANPAARLQAAADAKGIGEVWKREATSNGVNR